MLHCLLLRDSLFSSFPIRLHHLAIFRLEQQRTGEGELHRCGSYWSYSQLFSTRCSLLSFGLRPVTGYRWGHDTCFCQCEGEDPSLSIADTLDSSCWLERLAGFHQVWARASRTSCWSCRRYPSPFVLKTSASPSEGWMPARWCIDLCSFPPRWKRCIFLLLPFSGLIPALGSSSFHLQLHCSCLRPYTSETNESSHLRLTLATSPWHPIQARSSQVFLRQRRALGKE